ncbi:MAG TPA: isoprenylcysteine carboxylmethyltransferase family protein [Gemmatimonadales bacterium]|nr:isoprenylcysteine carboxylmethyltransferase family protein [Gemmatimonadales bacterium]
MRYDLVIATTIPVLWLVWLTYWWYSARDVKRTIQPEPFRSQLKHRAPLIVGILCFAAPRWMPRPLTARFVPQGLYLPALGTLMLALGLGFAVWARRHLGRNWSAHVVVKEDHALIRTGPYRYVRHPIYTGILFAMLGMALAIGEWRALVGFVAMVLSFAIKSQHEEGRMRETFPEYADYARRTAALIPLVY